MSTANLSAVSQNGKSRVEVHDGIISVRGPDGSCSAFRTCPDVQLIAISNDGRHITFTDMQSPPHQCVYIYDENAWWLSRIHTHTFAPKEIGWIETDDISPPAEMRITSDERTWQQDG